MKGYNGFIVQLKNHLNDRIEYSSGVKLYKDPQWELGENAPMIGVILATPQDNTTKAQVGDLLFFEHGITLQNRFRSISRYCLNERDKTYFVPFDKNDNKTIAFKKNGEWHLIGKYNLLEPIKLKRQQVTKKLILPNIKKGYYGYEEGVAYARLLTEKAKKYFNEGDKVALSAHSEYKVELEGKEYFAVSTENITAKLNF